MQEKFVRSEVNTKFNRGSKSRRRARIWKVELTQRLLGALGILKGS